MPSVGFVSFLEVLRALTIIFSLILEQVQMSIIFEFFNTSFLAIQELEKRKEWASWLQSKRNEHSNLKGASLKNENFIPFISTLSFLSQLWNFTHTEVSLIPAHSSWKGCAQFHGLSVWFFDQCANRKSAQGNFNYNWRSFFRQLRGWFIWFWLGSCLWLAHLLPRLLITVAFGILPPINAE